MRTRFVDLCVWLMTLISLCLGFVMAHVVSWLAGQAGWLAVRLGAEQHTQTQIPLVLHTLSLMVCIVSLMAAVIHVHRVVLYACLCDFRAQNARVAGAKAPDHHGECASGGQTRGRSCEMRIRIRHCVFVWRWSTSNGACANMIVQLCDNLVQKELRGDRRPFWHNAQSIQHKHTHRS